MSSAAVYALIFFALAVVALVVVWWLAHRVKTGLDESPGGAAGARTTLELASVNVERLRELSAEPILLKQSEEGVRVQIEHRPMLPLMAFVGKDVSGAITEAAGRITQQWGPKWVVLLTASEDGRVSAQRLA